MARESVSTSTTIPKDVIIVGGSLSALMQGLVLERFTTDKPPSHMAGVCLGPDVLRLLGRYDRAATIPLGIRAELLQSVDREGRRRPFLHIHRIMSSWDALYFRLRANFDGLATEYIPSPPGPRPLEGESIASAKARARYQVGQEVVDIRPASEGRVSVSIVDVSGEVGKRELAADLVLGADGPNSVVRKVFVPPGLADRRYANYVAWRGVVPELQASKETREIFSKNITYFVLKAEGAHAIVYNIPGDAGSVATGQRLLNFCLYLNVAPGCLDEIMTDSAGVRHQISGPPNKVHPEVWAQQKASARRVLPAPYVEIMDKIASPFVHLITDYCSPRASFLEGKVLLVGDASALLRPHIAFSTNQAAYQALLTERLVKGELDVAEWEYQVTAATYLHWKRSVWFGQFFQQPLAVALISAVQYWAVAALNRLRTWAGWLSGQAV
ncbi:conserved hypothetical protein [Talaromyces stipitatus ATCC 10500]|uniref:2,6-dihydroxypyridine 3-monooxygenase substrate binding domain-containing protein n=1 Tax=Talaromyces stipitatus (strain ATCC 10500 / CBS 375.48 / QM 6759 / NRRL 1006) TaxID=441959 RepID=B8MN69_TALSN|nr:uncharacterized protein TSTA_107250 [Talaromyces stipitatus ATCC 10500]EED14518.1 conserved hypothetical protein [Talaromyces stipitatus ATCC 10500]